jgi:hypothetical protein
MLACKKAVLLRGKLEQQYWYIPGGSTPGT